MSMWMRCCCKKIHTYTCKMPCLKLGVDQDIDTMYVHVQLTRCPVASAKTAAAILKQTLKLESRFKPQVQPLVSALLDKYAHAVHGDLRNAYVAFARSMCASILPLQIATGVRLLAKLPPPSKSSPAQAILDIYIKEVIRNRNAYVRMVRVVLLQHAVPTLIVAEFL